MVLQIWPAQGLAATFRLIYEDTVDEVAVDNVADGPCIVYAVYLTSQSSATAFMKFYDHANPTVGTTAPNMILPQLSAGGGPFLWMFRNGVEFQTALSFAAVTTAGTAGTTAPTGGDLSMALVVR